ncbi:MAG: RloB domain-containing protein, partial [Eggerthellaceae bacterium]
DEGNKHPNMETLFPRLPKALNHASKLRKNHTWQGYGSPRADVDLLVEELNCQANRGGELFERNEPSWNDLSMHHCGFN